MVVVGCLCGLLQDLKRNLELNSQSYTRQIRRCESKHHQTKLELKQMKENYRNLQIRLKVS